MGQYSSLFGHTQSYLQTLGQPVKHVRDKHFSMFYPTQYYLQTLDKPVKHVGDKHYSLFYPIYCCQQMLDQPGNFWQGQTLQLTFPNLFLLVRLRLAFITCWGQSLQLIFTNLSLLVNFTLVCKTWLLSAILHISEKEKMFYNIVCRAQCYKTLFVRNSQIFILSQCLLDQAGKACKGQTLQLITEKSKLQMTKGFVTF